MDQTYRIVISQRADDSLRSITQYLIATASETIAEKVRSGIMEEIRKLSGMPSKNPPLQLNSDLLITYRRVLKWSYRIIYTIEEEDLIVIIVEIDHASRNPQELEKILF